MGRYLIPKIVPVEPDRLARQPQISYKFRCGIEFAGCGLEIKILTLLYDLKTSRLQGACANFDLFSSGKYINIWNIVSCFTQSQTCLIPDA